MDDAIECRICLQDEIDQLKEQMAAEALERAEKEREEREQREEETRQTDLKLGSMTDGMRFFLYVSFCRVVSYCRRVSSLSCMLELNTGRDS